MHFEQLGFIFQDCLPSESVHLQMRMKIQVEQVENGDFLHILSHL